MNDSCNRLRPLLVLFLALLSAGCLQGPRAFRASHALHNEALRIRVDEELLLNLVRLRYRDSPLFLKVGSVVTQFEMRSSLGASGSLVEGGPGSLGVNAGVVWSEQPTYTFTPLQDDEFVRRMLTPLDLELVVLLQRSGWSIERVLRLTVQNFAGLENASSASGPTPDSAPEFAEFLRLTRALRGLQREGGIALVYEERPTLLSPPIESAAVLGADLVEAVQSGLRFRPADGAPSQLVLTRTEKQPVLLVAPALRGSAQLQEFASLLGLDSESARFELVAGVGAPESAAADGRLNVSLRSLLGMFFYLSHGIDVPDAHAAAGLVTLTRDAEGQAFDWRQLTGDLLRVQTSPTRPERSAVAVPFRGHWFYVEESDLESKSTLALLIELLNMSAHEDLDAAPTLTLAVGG